MATTPNFGWSTPDNTGLVKNGALDIRTLGNAIDASMADLKGGTTGQVLAKATNTDMDFTWVTDATGIPATIFDAKGDIIAATAADTASRLAVGTNGQILTADSTAATGLKWATPATSGFVGALATASNTNLSITSGTVTVLALSGEEFDTDGFHSTTTNTSRMTIPSGKAGKYLLTAYFDFQFPAAGQYFMVRISKNGTNLSSSNRGFCGNVRGNQFEGGTVSTIVDAAVGDYYEVNLQEGNTETLQFWVRFGIQYLGA